MFVIKFAQTDTLLLQFARIRQWSVQKFDSEPGQHQAAGGNVDGLLTALLSLTTAICRHNSQLISHHTSHNLQPSIDNRHTNNHQPSNYEIIPPFCHLTDPLYCRVAGLPPPLRVAPALPPHRLLLQVGPLQCCRSVVVCRLLSGDEALHYTAWQG